MRRKEPIDSVRAQPGGPDPEPVPIRPAFFQKITLVSSPDGRAYVCPQCHVLMSCSWICIRCGWVNFVRRSEEIAAKHDAGPWKDYTTGGYTKKSRGSGDWK